MLTLLLDEVLTTRPAVAPDLHWVILRLPVGRIKHRVRSQRGVVEVVEPGLPGPVSAESTTEEETPGVRVTWVPKVQ